MRYLLQHTTRLLMPYYGLISARAEFDVHDASVAASYCEACAEVAAKHYSAQLATAHETKHRNI